MVAMDLGVDLADIFAERPLKRDRSCLHDQHFLTQLACGGRDLGAYEPCADEQHSRPARDRPPEVRAVTQRAERVHVRRRRDAGQLAWRSSKGQH